MKKIISGIVAFLICFSLASCSVDVSSFMDEGDVKKTMDQSSFESLLATLPLSVISTEYVEQDMQLRTLYPDMLRVILKNNSEYDIKSAVVSFAAWDANNLPIKIKGAIDFTDGAYIRQVSFDAINLIPGATFGEEHGYEIDKNCHIASFKAVVLSFETFDGKVWKNPYYDEWCDLYEGTKITESMSVLVKLEDEDSVNIGSVITTDGDNDSGTVPPNKIEPSDTQTSDTATPNQGNNGFTALNFGDSVSLDFVEISVISASYSDELYPTDLSGVYLYKQDVENEKYFYLSTTMKNIGAEEYSVGETKALLTFNGKYKYDAQLIVGQGNTFTGTSVKPFESVKVYVCASVPDEMINMYETCNIRFAFDDNFTNRFMYEIEEFPYKYEVNVAK